MTENFKDRKKDSVSSGRSRGLFVGRDQEMGKLQAALEEALAGQGCLVMLAGEPGIGKTRTAQEVVALAEKRGAQAYWGWCYEGGGSPPYWPWVQPIRSLLETMSQADLKAQLGPGAEDIAEIIPELREMLPGVEAPPTLEPAQARFRLFDSISTFLKNAAAKHPLVMVLDDLHWADRPSLLLLEFLVRKIGEDPIMLLGCYRDMEVSRQHPLFESLAQLSREPVFSRHPLRGLHRDDTLQFVQTATGKEPPGQLVDAIHSQTEGNPFFTGEVVRLLADQGKLDGGQDDTPGEMRIPDGVIEVIGQRLNRLSEGCNRLLSLASVIGREFEFGLLGRLEPETSELQLLELVEEAEAARVIEESPGAVDRYRFAHALIQQTLVQELTTSRRVRLHARVAQALEETYGVQSNAHAAELSYHFGEAQTVLGAGKLVGYTLVAGEQALAAYAWEDALGYFNAGLESKEGQEMDGQTAALWFGRAQGEVATGLVHDGWASCARAFDYYAKVRDLPKVVTVAEFAPDFLAGMRDVSRLAAEALSMVPAGSHEAGRLWANHGRNLAMIGGDYDGGMESFRNTLSIARREGDEVLEMRTWAFTGQAEFWNLHFQASIDASMRAVDLAERLGDLHFQVMSRYWAAFSMRALGDIEGIEALAPGIMSAAEKLRDQYGLASAHQVAVIPPAQIGDWAAADHHIEQGLSALAVDGRSLYQKVCLAYQVGDFERCEHNLERLLEVTGNGSFSRPVGNAALAYLIPMYTYLSGDTKFSDAGAAAGAAVLSLPGLPPHFAAWARQGMAIVAVMAGDTAEAAEHYRYLESAAGTYGLGDISVDRLLGKLAHSLGRMEQAAVHFEDALTFSRAVGYRPELAWTCHDYAELMLNQDGRGKRDQASSLLDEALSLSTELGMKPLLERVTSLRQKVGSQPTERPAYPDGLTAREVEVLGLVAQGKTNQEIAEELIIALNTVLHHVSNILSKTGSANRTEAAVYANRSGLVG